MPNKIMNFGELVEQLEKAYNNLEKKGYSNWRGPLLTNNQMLCTDYNIDQQLSKHNVKFQKEENSHSNLQIILRIAVQLGIQQGIYLVEENPFSYLETDNIDEFLYKVRYVKHHKK